MSLHVRCLVRSLPMRLESVPLVDVLSKFTRFEAGASGAQWAHAGTSTGSGSGSGSAGWACAASSKPCQQRQGNGDEETSKFVENFYECT